MYSQNIIFLIKFPKNRLIVDLYTVVVVVNVVTIGVVVTFLVVVVVVAVKTNATLKIICEISIELKKEQTCSIPFR